MAFSFIYSLPESPVKSLYYESLFISNIRNANGIIWEIAKSFICSPKRKHFFGHLIESVPPVERRVKLKDLCPTCWVQSIDSYLLLFYNLYPAIIKIMELISNCSSKYGDWSWDSETLTKANQPVSFINSLNFLFHSALQWESLVVFDT